MDQLAIRPPDDMDDLMLDVEKFCEPEELYAERKVLGIPTPTITQTVPIIQPVVQKIVDPANAKKQVNKLYFYYFSKYKNMIVDNSKGCGSSFLLTKEGHNVICHHYVVHEAEFARKRGKGEEVTQLRPSVGKRSLWQT